MKSRVVAVREAGGPFPMGEGAAEPYDGVLSGVLSGAAQFRVVRTTGTGDAAARAPRPAAR